MANVDECLAGVYSAATAADSCAIARLPVELHQQWLQYLSQPELLRIGALSHFWRSLAVKESRYYLAICLQHVRNQHAVFAQRLDDAVRRDLRVAVIIYLRYAWNNEDPTLLAETVFPHIEKSMSHVRKLSIVSPIPLPFAARDFLRAPAPQLHEFVFRIDPDIYSEQDYGNPEGWLEDETYDGPAPAYLEVLDCDIFRCAAPRLERIDIQGLTALPEHPVAAFCATTRVTLCDLYPFPALGLGAHFPAATHMRLTVERAWYGAGGRCAQGAYLPAGLARLDVRTSVRRLRELLDVANLAAVPDLCVSFDWQYALRGPHAPAVKGPRDEVWAACLASLSVPHTIRIFGSCVDLSGLPCDVHVVVSSAAETRASVTFWAQSGFSDNLSRGEAEYGPLSSLGCLSASVTEISVEALHVGALFSIAKALPTLRSLHVMFDKRARMRFWKMNLPREKMLECPSLSQLKLSCNAAEGENILAIEVVLFASAIGLPGRHRPRLVLQNVTVEGGELLSGFFLNQVT